MEIIACPSCGYNELRYEDIYRVCKACGTKVTISFEEQLLLQKQRERRREERLLMAAFEEAADGVVRGLEKENYKVSSNLEGLGCLVSVLFVVVAFVIYACVR